MAFSHCPLTLFPGLNDSPIEITNSSEPRQSALASIYVLNFPTISVKQPIVAQFDIDANHYTLKSCVETVIAVSNLSCQLQDMTNEVHQLNAQLSLLQRMYKDAREEISNFKKQNKELK
ncbi:hypothetical protein ACSBR1_025802 [Camellia fascicularis]